MRITGTGLTLAGLSAACCCPAAAQSGEEPVRLTVNADRPTHEINPNVYGHFYEHIYHSANDGL